jgi:hypothetical protein
MGITCLCSRFYTDPIPSHCKHCGRRLGKKEENKKTMPVQIDRAEFGMSFRLTRHIRRH